MQSSLSSNGNAPTRDEVADPVLVIRSIQERSRYFFEPAEFAQLAGVPANSPSVGRALRRLAKRGFIKRIAKAPTGWLIIPAEQAHYGAPPVTWWLDDAMKGREPDYYVALLSAAKHWGSAHYAIQTTQVMVASPRRSMTVGKLKVDFVVKRGLEKTPTTVVSADVAAWKVSTREATLFDLMRHQAHVGGIESIARIVRDFGPFLVGDEITKAANATAQVATAQRLGFLFDRLRMSHAANRLDEWLVGRRMPYHPLEHGEGQDVPIIDERWHVRYNTRHLTMLEEVS